ncbi:AAA family ATPase [Oryzihumus leptocrescens]|uniref:Nuclease SbcCD subunit C n=1 Tax=Oryzihumus leptocrescens TaxID=297536 RepID=A0A542ZKY4_9MICO|nr:SMC family ATPase [Oryzihumus leptocrescens]TQL60959.1 exonuclease SbcC [Oryzihumus leptocrescens]
MRPLRLFLDGFGSYREATDLDFTDVDFFALVGPTGSGKSTVIDALCFALYGTVPRWGKENVIAHALAPSANACRVALVFEAANARYAAVRLLTRDARGKVHTREARLDRLDRGVSPDGDLNAVLEASVEQIAEGADRVTAAVKDLLGLSYEHFTQCVLLPQGRFAEFLQAKPGERQDLLVQLLAYGVYEQVGQRARQRAQLATASRTILQAQRDELAGATKEAEDEARARVDELGQLMTSVTTQLDGLDAARTGAAQTAAAANENRAAAAQLAQVAIPDGVTDLAARIAAEDMKVATARSARHLTEVAEDEARVVRGSLGDSERYERWRSAYSACADTQQTLTHQNAALERLRAAQAEAHLRLEAAEAAVETASADETTARAAHAAAAIAATLHLGDNCPVCQQQVQALPHHEPATDLEQATAALTAARQQCKKAAAIAHVSAAKVAGAQRDVETTEALLLQHTASLDGAPSRADVEAALAAIMAADHAVTDAAEQARRARAAVSAAETARAALDAAEQQARRTLGATRDALSALTPPPLTGNHLAEDWNTLLTWAQRQNAACAAAQPSLDQAAANARAKVGSILDIVHTLLAEHGLEDIPDADVAPVALAGHQAHADAALNKIRTDRERASALDKQLAACADEIAVATTLGDLLRATQFERWLCGEALDSLVTEASTTLMELSGGQYELDRTSRNEFAVIDYNDAGTRRPVHTLSGGETFQASLALALALSRQVVGLSAGMRALDSMFLDEGFGTLDENTLDTVAHTLERLAADKDRMVGVVTHVPALAERVPVQFVVSRDATTSRVRKMPT